MRLFDRLKRYFHWGNSPRVVGISLGRIVIQTQGCSIEIDEGGLDRLERVVTSVCVTPYEDGPEGVFRLIKKQRGPGVLHVVKLKRSRKPKAKPVTDNDILKGACEAGNRAVDSMMMETSAEDRRARADRFYRQKESDS